MKKITLILATALASVMLSGCSVPGRTSDGGNIISADEEGYGEGRIGDTMRSCFFDFTIKDAYLCDVYGSYIPGEGYDLLVADLTVKNTVTSSLPMFDSDFMVTWGDGDEDYDVPATFYAGSEGLLGDEVLPSEYTLKVNESRDGLLIFEVPEGINDFSIFYLELFDDDSTGDAFFVYFTAEKQ